MKNCLSYKPMSKGTYERRKALGLCTKCGSDKNVEGVFCKDCKAKIKKYKAEYRQSYIEHRVCPDCRVNPLIGKHHSCFDCQEKKKIRAKKYDDEHKEERRAYYFKYYADKVSQGLCVKCGKRKTGGRSWCQTCLAVQKQKMADKRAQTIVPRSIAASLGICPVCYKPIDREGRLCGECATRAGNHIKQFQKPNEYWDRQNRLIRY